MTAEKERGANVLEMLARINLLANRPAILSGLAAAASPPLSQLHLQSWTSSIHSPQTSHSPSRSGLSTFLALLDNRSPSQEVAELERASRTYYKSDLYLFFQLCHHWWSLRSFSMRLPCLLLTLILVEMPAFLFCSGRRRCYE